MADQKHRTKGKGGFDYKRIHKVITLRETQHLGKGRVAGRGRAIEALISMCFSWAKKHRSRRGCCAPALLRHTLAAKK